MSVIQLHSGVFFDLARPDPALIRLDDIAWSLAGLTRYCAHADRHVSVAEHCVHVSLLCDPDDAPEGLMHDAVESLVGDVSGPLKTLLPDYQRVEACAWRAVAARFRLRETLPDSVKAADYRMLGIEARAVMGAKAGDPHWGRCLSMPDDPRIERIGRSPKEARVFFLNRCEELGVGT